MQSGKSFCLNTSIFRTYKSSRSKMCFKIGVFNPNFAGKYVCWSFFLINLQAYFRRKRLQHKCFPVKVMKVLRTSFFIQHLWWLLLYLFSNLSFVSNVLENYLTTSEVVMVSAGSGSSSLNFIVPVCCFVHSF